MQPFPLCLMYEGGCLVRRGFGGKARWRAVATLLDLAQCDVMKGAKGQRRAERESPS